MNVIASQNSCLINALVRAGACCSTNQSECAQTNILMVFTVHITQKGNKSHCSNRMSS